MPDIFQAGWFSWRRHSVVGIGRDLEQSLQAITSGQQHQINNWDEDGNEVDLTNHQCWNHFDWREWAAFRHNVAELHAFNPQLELTWEHPC